MPSYVSPLRDLQFALTDLLDVPDTLAAMPECAVSGTSPSSRQDRRGLCGNYCSVMPD